VAEVRLVRFRAEWVEELPADPEPGDRVAAPPFGELVVREVREPRRVRTAADVAAGPNVWTRERAEERELRGADVLVEVGPHAIEPGSTWRAEIRLDAREGFQRGDGTIRGADHRTLEAPTLAGAIDALADWAEAWVAGRAGQIGVGSWPWTGQVSLGVAEPSNEKPRALAEFGFAGRNADYVLAGLQRLQDEAERLYGGR
jgi:hypothetical protein